jgi:hypothetical protein
MFKVTSVNELITHCENRLNELDGKQYAMGYDEGFYNGQIKVYTDLLCFLNNNLIYDEDMTEELYYEEVCDCGKFHCKDYEKHSCVDLDKEKWDNYWRDNPIR